jgi:uncharacterized protein (DUF885 family)
MLLALACAVPWAGAADAATPTAARELARLINAQWQADLRADPLLATAAGDARYNDRLPDASAAAFEHQARADAAFLARLRRIDRAALPATDRLNRDLLEFVLEHRVALAPFKAWRIPLVSDEGFHIEVTRMADGVPMRTVRDYEDYLARLAAIRLHAAGRDSAGRPRGHRGAAVSLGAGLAVLRTVPAPARRHGSRRSHPPRGGRRGDDPQRGAAGLP